MVTWRIFTVVEKKSKKKGNSGLSSKKMDNRENSFVDEPIPKTAHQVGKESGKITDRQLNASVNMKMKGRFTKTGAEWKAADELARSLYDTMKPQLLE